MFSKTGQWARSIKMMFRPLSNDFFKALNNALKLIILSIAAEKLGIMNKCITNYLLLEQFMNNSPIWYE